MAVIRLRVAISLYGFQSVTTFNSIHFVESPSSGLYGDTINALSCVCVSVRTRVGACTRVYIIS